MLLSFPNTDCTATNAYSCILVVSPFDFLYVTGPHVLAIHSPAASSNEGASIVRAISASPQREKARRAAPFKLLAAPPARMHCDSSYPSSRRTGSGRVFPPSPKSSCTPGKTAENSCLHHHHHQQRHPHVPDGRLSGPDDGPECNPGGPGSGQGLGQISHGAGTADGAAPYLRFRLRFGFKSPLSLWFLQAPGYHWVPCALPALLCHWRCNLIRP